MLLHIAPWFLAQTQPAAAPAGPLGGIMGILLMFVVIYFLMIRPAGKQRKEQQGMLNALKKDDEVVTASGIYGKIVSLEEKIVILEIADRVKIRMLRDRIAAKASAELPPASTKGE